LRVRALRLELATHSLLSSLLDDGGCSVGTSRTFGAEQSRSEFTIFFPAGSLSKEISILGEGDDLGVPAGLSKSDLVARLKCDSGLLLTTLLVANTVDVLLVDAGADAKNLRAHTWLSVASICTVVQSHTSTVDGSGVILSERATSVENKRNAVFEGADRAGAHSELVNVIEATQATAGSIFRGVATISTSTGTLVGTFLRQSELTARLAAG